MHTQRHAIARQAKYCPGLPEILVSPRVPLQAAKTGAMSLVEGESYSGFVSGVGHGPPERARRRLPGSGSLRSLSKQCLAASTTGARGKRARSDCFCLYPLPSTHTEPDLGTRAAHQTPCRFCCPQPTSVTPWTTRYALGVL
jgi:hypothetical protein